MTSENRFIVGIEDIKAMSLECNKCKARLTYSLDDAAVVPQVPRVPPNCPNPSCNVEWYSNDMGYNSTERKYPVLLKLVAAITEIRHRQKESEVERANQLGFRVLFEFDESK
jgi:hypothetical protein